MDHHGVPQTAAERGKVAPAKLAHVVLRSTDPDRLVAWYRIVLEAEVAMANQLITFLTYDDEHHRIAIARFPGVTPPPMATGVDHIAFTYDTPDDLFATYDRLKGEGIEPYWTVNHGPTISFYYRDPDGNRLELQFDIQEDAAGATEWFATSDFDTNPIGVRVAAEDLIRRYRAGEDRDALFARPRIDPSQVMAQLPQLA